MEPLFVHPSAICDSDDVGEGTRIWPFAHVMKGAMIGRDCNIGEQVFVESGVVIADGVVVKNGVQIWDGVVLGPGVFVGPGVVFTNDRFPRSRALAGVPAVAQRYAKNENWLSGINVAEGASLGAGCVIVPGVSIGAYAMVAAGAVVTRDVAPNRLVQGNPARPTGWVCACGIPVDAAPVGTCPHGAGGS